MYLVLEDQGCTTSLGLKGGNPEAGLFSNFINFKQTKQDKILERLKSIKDKTFQELDSFSELNNAAEKIIEIFIKESKEMIELKLFEFEKKIQFDFFVINEILENLQKLEENMLSSIKQGMDEIKKKVELNEDCFDSSYKEELVNEHSSDLKKRKKIPHKAVAVLKEWLVEHIQDPYPTNEVKEELAKKTNLNVKQVHNWFINARGRIWKKLFVQERFGNLVEKLYIQSMTQPKN